MDRMDGVKMLFGEKAWLLVRASGTENVLRLYAEAPSPERCLLADRRRTLRHGRIREARQSEHA